MENLITLQGLYDAAYYFCAGKPSVILFCRDSNGNKQIGFSQTFYPYIFVEKSEYNRMDSYLANFVRGVEEVKTPFLLDANKQLLKLYVNSPSKVYQVKRALPEVYEGDIQFVNRFVIDRVCKLTAGKNRIVYVDIETTSNASFPNYRDPKEAIITIGLYDNFDDIYHQWIWHPKESVQSNDSNRRVYNFTNEKDMLNAFLDKFAELSPDYFIAWNVSFDINYLCARLECLHLNWSKLSPLWNSEKIKRFAPDLELVRWQEGKGLVGKKIAAKEKEERNIRILGLQWFDLLSAYRFLIRDERPSWKLEIIAKQELGIGKSMESKFVGKMWELAPQKVLDYNYTDVMLIKKLDDKLKITEYFKTLKDLAHLININDTFSSGRIIDNYMLHKYHGQYIFPSKKFVEEKADVGGGLVRDPIVGVHKNVAVFDFAGCYPNIIKTFNLSPDTFVNENVIFNNNTTDEKDNIELFNQEKMFDVDGKKVTYKIRTDKYQADLTYDLTKKGLLIQLIDELVALRKIAKKEADKYEYGTVEHQQWSNIEQSYKPIINGIFGVCGFSGFRLYNNATASAITAFARMLSKYVGISLKNKGFEVVGGDTDSIFVKLHTQNLNDNLKEVLEQMFPIIKEAINDFVKIFLPEEYHRFNTLEMDNDKIYSSLLFLDVKKRYIGLLKYYKKKPIDNKIHYMGLDLKKSNTIEISKNAQLDVALALLKEDDMIEDVMLTKYKKVLQSEDIDDFKISSKLEKPHEEYKSQTPAVRASLWSNKHLGKAYGTNSKFYIIWVTKDSTVDNTNIIAFDDKEDLEGVKFKIDKVAYLEDVYNKIDNIVRGLPTFKKMNDNIFLQHKTRNKGLKEFMKEKNERPKKNKTDT